MLSIPQAAQSLINWRYSINEESILNNGKTPDKGNAPDILELKQAINAIKAQAFATSNGKVDYRGLSSSTAYVEYRQATRHLQSFDPTTLNTLDERLAFWINLYNALVIDGVITFGITGSVNELPASSERRPIALTAIGLAPLMSNMGYYAPTPDTPLSLDRNLTRMIQEHDIVWKPSTRAYILPSSVPHAPALQSLYIQRKISTNS